MSAPALTAAELQAAIKTHLTFTLGKDEVHASVYDWRMALSFALRDQIVEPWFEATRKTYGEDRKRVYYLSLEFLIGRLLEDAAVNLGLRETAEEAMAALGQDLSVLIEDEPDAALGNGGLGRLAACFMESMATMGVPAMGYGIRYEHGLFRQRFQGGHQVEAPEDWLAQNHAWEFERPEAAYEIGFKGHVEDRDGRRVWVPGESVIASAHDTPIIGWKGRWANTLRLWAATPTTLFDLDRFNAGDYAAAAEPEALARTISRVLYPDDTTEAGKELRLKQEYFLVAAAVQDILRRFRSNHGDIRKLGDFVAIQMNDTHPALAGPELIRILMDEDGIAFDEAFEIAQSVLGYTNHTLLPEALERWQTWTIGNVLPRHMEIIEAIDAAHAAQHPDRPAGTAIVEHDQVKMGELSFITAHKVNGVSALHTDLVKDTVFADLNRLHPGRIVNETNGITPRRWLKLANPALSRLVTDTIGPGWEGDLDRLEALEPHLDDGAFLEAFGAAKRKNKVALAEWVEGSMGHRIDPDALFDVQIKRIHEYKRQLMNILQTIAVWHRIHEDPTADIVPRVRIFGGKAAPGYVEAKETIRLINDVAAVVNKDPVVAGRLTVLYPPNYNVSMAERLIPAADLSEQISTAGKEASGTGNMKFALNGALTIGTLDGANVEIREKVGAENFFLFGMTTPEAMARRETRDHARKAIGDCEELQTVLQLLAEGTFSPGDPTRYNGLLDRIWNHDPFLVASDYAAYAAAQAEVDIAWRDRAGWQKKAAANTARVGFFSSDRTIRGYMKDIWSVEAAF